MIGWVATMMCVFRALIIALLQVRLFAVVIIDLRPTRLIVARAQLARARARLFRHKPGPPIDGAPGANKSSPNLHWNERASARLVQ